MSENLRYEISYEGKLIQSKTFLSNKLGILIKQLFSQYGWVYSEVLKCGSYRKICITNPLGESLDINLFAANLRNEKSNPYEKKLQLSKANPHQYKDGITIILGFYVCNSADEVKDALIVGFPIDESLGYNNNPSLRGVFVNDILLKTKIDGVYIDEKRKLVGFRPEFIFYYLRNYASFHKYTSEDYHLKENSFVNNSSLKNLKAGRAAGGKNILLYGVPGCGKSYVVEKEYCKDAGKIERIVFHPDYTYMDFIGQILPCSNENKVTYDFIPGPFTKILKESYNNPSKKYCLVIEEINRGNASAIFGDIFQLLDRDESGNSYYKISNKDIAKEVYGKNDVQKKIFIPSNLTIVATMNTCDQNVFTLDTAFQRRWKMRMIENNIDKAREIANHKILDTDVTWKVFNKKINELILSHNVGNISAEDKRLGAYFVSLDDLIYLNPEDEGLTKEEVEKAKDNNRNFPEKVLKYLGDDAFKFNRSQIFNEKCTSLEQLIKTFESSKGNQRFDIFLYDIFDLKN